MAYTDTNSSFTSLAFRQDSDTKTWIKATALEDLTAGTPYLVFVGATGYEAQAIFDTGVTASAAQYHWAYVGVPAEAITSDGSGWLQIGGYNASVTLSETTITQGTAIKWHDAAFSNADQTYTGAANEWAVGAVSDSTGSNTAFAINQVPVRVSGST
jgi:hypothetical protein